MSHNRRAGARRRIPGPLERTRRRPAAAFPSPTSDARSSAGSWPPEPRDERPSARAGKTCRMWGQRQRESERMRWTSCARPCELFDQAAHHYLACFHEPHTFLAPLLEQVLGDVAIDRLHRVHHGEQPDLGTVLQQPLDRVLIADVERDAVEDDVVGIQCVQYRQDIWIGEDVKTMRMEEDIATVVLDACPKRRGVL